MKRPAARLSCALVVLMLGACANRPQPYDYTAFRAANPRSLLVLPPVNDSPEVKATASVWSHATRPLAEAGYYVLPVTLVDATLRENGIQSAHDAHQIPRDKLREEFGADAAVYMKVTSYGTTYLVLGSQTRVDVEARIVDLRSGSTLWAGRAFATSAESQQSSGGLVGLLVAAAVTQIVSTATDAAYHYAGIADTRLLGAPRFNGVLPGPRSPAHGQPMPDR